MFVSFATPNRYTEREIKALCPLTVPTNAVFFDPDDETIFKRPQLALVLYDAVTRARVSDEEVQRSQGNVGYLNAAGEEGEEYFANDQEFYCFLGYERADSPKDWAQAVAAWKEDEKRRNYETSLRMILHSLDESTADLLKQFLRGRYEDGVLTLQTESQRVLDALTPARLEKIAAAATTQCGGPVTVKKELRVVRQSL